MKRIVLAITLLALAACASSAPVRMADGTYMTSARVALGGQSGALSQAVEQANDFCGRQSQVASLVTNTARECALHGGCGESQITFTCVAP